MTTLIFSSIRGHCVMLTGHGGDFVGGGDPVIRRVIHVGHSRAHGVGQLQLGHQLLQKLHGFISSQVDHHTLYLQEQKCNDDVHLTRGLRLHGPKSVNENALLSN